LIQRKAQQIKDAGFFTRLGKGAEAGLEESKMLGGAALETLGTAVGSEGIKSYGREVLTDAVSEIGKLDPYSGEFLDIDSPGGALDWVAYTIGQFGIGILQTAAVAAGTGGAGLGAVALKAGAGKLLKKAATKRANKEALNKAEKKALEDAGTVFSAARFKALATVGGVAEIGTMSVGEAAAEQISRNGDIDPFSALLTGAAAGALDALPIMSALKRFSTPRGGQSLGRRVGGAAFTGGLQEGATEAAQDAIYAFGAGGLEALRDKPLAEYINAAAAGALGGSVLSASVATLQRGEEITKEEVDLTQPEQPEQPEQLRLTDERQLRLTDERAQLALPAPERDPEAAVTPPVDPEATPRSPIDPDIWDADFEEVYGPRQVDAEVTLPVPPPPPGQRRLTNRRSFGPPEPTDLDLERELLSPEQVADIKERDARRLQMLPSQRNYFRTIGNRVVSPDNLKKIRRAGNEALKAKGRRDNSERTQPLIQEAFAASRQSARDEPLRRAGVRGDAAAPGNVRLRVAAESGLGFPDIVEDTPAPILPPGQVDLFPDDPLRRGVRSDVPRGQGELFNDVTAPIPEAPRTPVNEDERQLGLFDPPDPNYRQREFDFGSTPEPEPGPGPTPEPGFEFAEDVSPNVATDYVLPYRGKGGKEATMTDTPQNMARRTVDWVRAVRNAKEKLKTC
jgi:hypothetical protein